MLELFLKEGIRMNLKKNGEFIARLRKEKKLTQEQLAEKMGVSINAVSKWERGLSFPDVSLLKDLCLELGISMEELINGEGNKSNEATEKAIISVVKTRDKARRKLKYVVIVSCLLFFILLVMGIISYKDKDKDKELEEYYERNYQMTFVARDVEAFLKYRYEGKYPEYYGGMYISSDAYNLIVQIVKDKIPKQGTQEYFYYNELYTVDDKIKLEDVKYSYNELEEINNKINDYFLNNKPFNDLNSWYIDVFRNKVVVNYVEVTEEVIKEFEDKVIKSEVILFESAIEQIDDSKKCTNYPEDIGMDILENHGEVLISIQVGNKDDVPVSLTLYDDGTYELFTAYESCPVGRMCNLILKYVKSIKGTYDYDIEKILENSTNANDKSYEMNNLPEYEIYLGEKYMKKYDTIMFTVEKNKKNKYLDELLKKINVDLSKCAKPEYKD